MTNQVTREIASTKITITIKRPNGEIETLDVTKQFPNITDAEFARIQASTKAAGRGEVLSYSKEHTWIERPATEMELVCRHQDMMDKVMGM